MATTKFTYVRGSLLTSYPPRPSEASALTWMTPQSSVSGYTYASRVVEQQARAAAAFLEVVGTVYASQDPQRMPLTHPLLLDVHYTLSCVLAAKAQAEARSPPAEDDNVTSGGEVVVSCPEVVSPEHPEPGDTSLQPHPLDSVTRAGIHTYQHVPPSA
ncbi:hypothetical protein DFH27DRAFT_529223 [Peziza echinospora]|nr:hypothetical protein DFH27DRAFT_529223 [Peziza echinospora]